MAGVRGLAATAGLPRTAVPSVFPASALSASVLSAPAFPASVFPVSVRGVVPSRGVRAAEVASASPFSTSRRVAVSLSSFGVMSFTFLNSPSPGAW